MILTVLLLFFALLRLDWQLTLTLLFAILILLYFLDLLFNAFLVFKGFYRSPEIKINDAEIEAYQRRWPSYTLLCPLYKESRILPQFVKAIENLDYPKERMEVLLLLEEDDRETIKAANSLGLPLYFKIVILPHSLPKTKAKACNFGLQIARGKYTVIYDAEDIPEPYQLKKAVIAFEKVGENVVCIQAKLDYYNRAQNLLTRLFSLEYSYWFGLILPGLHSIGAPIPLGGTSNHLKTEVLKRIHGWDAFNVTEDADLGIRLFKKGFRTVIMDSTTTEEANSSLKNWFRQRSRWIKGYIQTYLVHMRRPHEFVATKRTIHIITFQLIVGVKILSLIINPLLWGTTILYFTLRSSIGPLIESFFPTPIFYIGAFTLLVGNFLYLYYYAMGAAKRGMWELISYSVFVPFYWLFMSTAAIYAVWELLIKPHHWQKTHHGLHLDKPMSQNPAYPVNLHKPTGYV